MSLTLTDLAPLRDIRKTDEGYDVNTLVTPHGGIYGAYLMFQQVLIAELAAPGKKVISLQTAFANGGVSGQPCQVTVETLQSGRSFAFLSLTFRQGDVVVTRAEVMLTIDEADFLRHDNPWTTIPISNEWPSIHPGIFPGSAVRWPDSNPQELAALYSCDQSIDDSTSRALTALVTEPAVMAALMNFHEMPPAQAGRVAGNVLTQNVTLLRPVDLESGVLVRSRARYAGAGRVHGEGNLEDQSGALIGTFTTTGVLRGPRS
ncbi:MAG: thioesterase family protein [Actinomycetota bacterium]|nr:thioesterase family protein [Actinomycetota bacterium]